MSKEDPDTFDALIGKIKPIKQKANHPEFNRKVKQRFARKIEAQHARRLTYQKQGEALSANLDDLHAHIFTAMSTKQIEDAKEIDLHGMYIDDALRLLADKLSERTNNQLDYWLVVHGKGKNSPAYDRAPLKDAVLEFLLNHPAVAALTSIKDKDQRSGAVMLAVHKKLIF